jgi:4-hydroxybenzoate polyprenyltransferase
MRGRKSYRFATQQNGRTPGEERMALAARLRQILEMIRFSHTVFALPFALLAAVMAWSVPGPQGTAVAFRWQALVGILLCMVCGRSAAMALNRLADRHIDAENPRTRGRHLPAGILSPRLVAGFTLLMSAGFIASTLLFLPNLLPLLLSVPVLLFLFGYSFAKRFTVLAHYWLGAALMLAPLSAWIAIRGEVVLTAPSDLLPACFLGVAVLLWVGGFDILYACMDAKFDEQRRLYSVPARWGVSRALRIAAASHFAMLVVLVLFPFSASWGGPPLDLGWIYGISIAAVAILLAYEHAIVKPDDLSRVNIAFFQINALISIGLFVVVSLDLYL